jgi:hypothetical protein
MNVRPATTAEVEIHKASVMPRRAPETCPRVSLAVPPRALSADNASFTHDLISSFGHTGRADQFDPTNHAPRSIEGYVVRRWAAFKYVARLNEFRADLAAQAEKKQPRTLTLPSLAKPHQAWCQKCMSSSLLSGDWSVTIVRLSIFASHVLTSDPLSAPIDVGAFVCSRAAQDPRLFHDTIHTSRSRTTKRSNRLVPISCQFLEFLELAWNDLDRGGRSGIYVRIMERSEPETA